MSSELIFSLAPVNEYAREILNYGANAYSDLRDKGSNALGVGLSSSRMPGKLLTIGQDVRMDISLPRVDPNFTLEHCHFFLADSGELILRDLSNGYTQIEVINGTEEEVLLQRMPRALAGGLRQRVIPRSTRKTHIFLGLHADSSRGVGNPYAEFRFEWNPFLLENPDALIQHPKFRGASLFKPFEHLSVAEEEPQEGGHFTPSMYTITGQQKPAIKFHKYEILGRGSSGTVTKVVDYKSGNLWAVKEKRIELETEKCSFKNKLRTIHEVDHPNINRFEMLQVFWHEKHFQLFFKIRRGNLNHLLAIEGHQHECLRPRLSSRPRWTDTLENEILSALAYLHETRKMAHGSIKPENVLFDGNTASLFPEYNLKFYLSDFLLSPPHKLVGRSSIYLAPKIFRQSTVPKSPPSDMYAFGITLGIVEGYWCPNDINLSMEDWIKKLEANGISKYNQWKYRDDETKLRAAFEQQQSQDISLEEEGYIQARWCDHRVQSLGGIMRPMLQMLLQIA
ncbi:Protein kinase-like domain containing protein [Rhypophila decipiens]